MEKTLGHKIWDKNIKLYTKEYFLPNGAKHITGDNEFWHTQYNVGIEYSGQLKDYQALALWHVVENRGGLIEAATGSGKGHMIIGITEFFKKSTLIVTPTKKLVKELVDKFKEFSNYEPGTYYSDGKCIKDITITTHTSFVQDMLGEKNLGKFDVLLIDEVDDHLSQDMIYALCYSDCNILVGLSGTPSRQELNTQDLELIFGPHIKVGEYQIKPTEITHYVYRRTREEVETINYTNWHTQRESIIGNRYRFDVVSDTIKEITGRSFLTLLLLDRKEEIKKYSQRFPEAIVITGDTKVKDDEIGIERLKKSGGLIIGSIKKMYRGVDIPECDSVIVASPIRFENNVIQSIGRSLRTCKGKEKVSISIINDDVLQSQRYEQTRVCKSEYCIQPQVVYIKKLDNEKTP